MTMNKMRGDVSVNINGKSYVARLNLQQIAEIEDAIGSIAAFVLSAQSGKIKASHVFAIIKIALDGKVSEDDILAVGVNGLINQAMEILVPVFDGNIKNTGKSNQTGEA